MVMGGSTCASAAAGIAAGAATVSARATAARPGRAVTWSGLVESRRAVDISRPLTGRVPGFGHAQPWLSARRTAPNSPRPQKDETGSIERRQTPRRSATAVDGRPMSAGRHRWLGVVFRIGGVGSCTTDTGSTCSDPASDSDRAARDRIWERFVEPSGLRAVTGRAQRYPSTIRAARSRPSAACSAFARRRGARSGRSARYCSTMAAALPV